MSKRKKKKSVKFTKFEKVLFVITAVICLSYPFMSIFAKSTLSEVNYQLENNKEEIEKQSKNNESLQMKINELASLENLEQVAKKMGLSYTSNSIKTIDK
ncbi:MAG: cell division protein FtsL [Bacilli bacterium]